MDFPICFAAVRLLGVERIGYYEHVIFESVKGAVDAVWPSKQGANADSEQDKSLTTNTDTREGAAQAQGNGENASKCLMLSPSLIQALAVTNCHGFSRSMDTTCTCLRDSQESHLYSSTLDSSHYP